LSVLIIGLCFLLLAATFALVQSVRHADEGFEDANGYHSLKQGLTGFAEKRDFANYEALRSTVDTGNPWDYVEGSACPWKFDPTDHHHGPTPA
jgi:hypothetical protein